MQQDVLPTLGRANRVCPCMSYCSFYYQLPMPPATKKTDLKAVSPTPEQGIMQRYNSIVLQMKYFGLTLSSYDEIISHREPIKHENFRI